MQINSASSFTPQSALNIGGDKQTQINDQRERLVVQQEQDKARQKSAQNSAQNNQTERLDIDPDVIALVEQNQQSDQNQQLSVESNVQQQAQSRQSSQAGYDQPSQQNITAVSAYQSVDGIAQRDSIQQAFGVDLYA